MSHGIEETLIIVIIHFPPCWIVYDRTYSNTD